MASLKVQKATSSDKNLLQPQYGVELTMYNRAHSVLKLDRCFTWSGAPTNPGFPDNIPSNSTTTFTYLRGVDDGSIAAVVYTGENEYGAYAFVLAWDAPTDNTPTPNRVYVNSAPKSVIDYYTFDQIREYLGVSGQHSEARDRLSRSSASADISDSNPNIATVTAHFSASP
ncbi:hypothetical protein RND81_05G232300 [Saponaria officinalis]|uniref:Uncharacterized protein n=1 Tax=Saponaria officinalis TaxID=3572 RepID=A0AAW1L371_SAPOF